MLAAAQGCSTPWLGMVGIAYGAPSPGSMQGAAQEMVTGAAVLPLPLLWAAGPADARLLGAAGGMHIFGGVMPLALPVSVLVMRLVPVLALRALPVTVPVTVPVLVSVPIPVPVFLLRVVLLPLVPATLSSVPICILRLQLLLEVGIPAPRCSPVSKIREPSACERSSCFRAAFITLQACCARTIR